MTKTKFFDVLCVGHASYDLIFSVPRHPAEDEKMVAQNFTGVGGGPAANAAVMVARLGFKSAFSGFISNDLYGVQHWQELDENHVDCSLAVRGTHPTPLSVIVVKPDGKRSLINYKGDTLPLAADAIDFSGLSASVILFDGHEPAVSTSLVDFCRMQHITTVLDAGSVHQGTLDLLDKVDYLVCSEKFARQMAPDENNALSMLAEKAPIVVITLGQRGLVWQIGQEKGHVPAVPVTAIDTTGAGDAFHGAFAAAIASDLDWSETLHYASAAGAFCCTRSGARQGLATQQELTEFMHKQKTCLK